MLLKIISSFKQFSLRNRRQVQTISTVIRKQLKRNEKNEDRACNCCSISSAYPCITSMSDFSHLKYFLLTPPYLLNAAFLTQEQSANTNEDYLQ